MAFFFYQPRLVRRGVRDLEKLVVKCKREGPGKDLRNQHAEMLFLEMGVGDAKRPF